MSPSSPLPLSPCIYLMGVTPVCMSTPSISSSDVRPLNSLPGSSRLSGMPVRDLKAPDTGHKMLLMVMFATKWMFTGPEVTNAYIRDSSKLKNSSSNQKPKWTQLLTSQNIQPTNSNCVFPLTVTKHFVCSCKYIYTPHHKHVLNVYDDAVIHIFFFFKWIHTHTASFYTLWWFIFGCWFVIAFTCFLCASWHCNFSKWINKVFCKIN